MARFLLWKDLTAEQLEKVRHPHPKKGLTGRDLLAQFVGITDAQDPRNKIALDLYVNTLQVAQENCFTDSKMSCLFSIVKEVHLKSTAERLTVEKSFTLFKKLLLMHSVHRPPYSIGVFTYKEMQEMLQFMLHVYYRHYNLYLYVFTNRVTMTLTSSHPLDIVEVSPALQPLMESITEEERIAELSEEAKEAEALSETQRLENAESAENARLARLREEYQAAVPEEIKDKVAAAVEKEVALLKTVMEEKFSTSMAELMEKLATLQDATGVAMQGVPPGSAGVGEPLPPRPASKGLKG